MNSAWLRPTLCRNTASTPRSSSAPIHSTWRARLDDTFTLLPMFFLGGGFPAEILPPALQAVSPWLPTTMLNSLLSPLLAGGALPAAPWWPALGLLAYTLAFAGLAAWRFRWE